ncbi:MAG TPA: TadE/TadG family type IV pilus assembly protein, partial [Gemmatimonadales bacterium]
LWSWSWAGSHCVVALGRMQDHMKPKVGGLRGTQGQALVELALLLPFLMLLLLGVLEISRAWQHKQTLTDVAREGARLSVIDNALVTKDSTTALIKSMIANAAFDSSTVTIVWPLGCRWTGVCTPLIGRGEITAVELTQQHQFVAIHRLVQLATNGSGQMTLRTTSRMRVE